MLTVTELWQYLDERFSSPESPISPISYQTWIETVTPKSFDGKTLVFEVPSELHKNYWINHLLTNLVEMAYEKLNQEIDVQINIQNEVKPVLNPVEETTITSETPDITPTIKHNTQLNSKYTFNTFVTGKGNQMAHAAALVVAEEPGHTYNPLFFYGGVGLGKTHLMHAIGHQLLEREPNANVKYITSEAFTNDFINSIRNQTQEQFRSEFRAVDMLLVDDIQFFADKEGIQEEFFHTFNALYEQNKQIVLTSDRLPNEIPKLQDRLVSRFKWGLSVDITPPDLETRIAILRNKADADHLEIPDDTLAYIAGQIDSNVRELEGALVRVQAYATMNKSEITTSLAADALKNLKLDPKNNSLSISRVQDVVAKYYQVTTTDLKGKKRVKQIVMPRQIAMYLTRELTDNSLPKIGQEFGGKDHTTVIHAYDKIAQSLETDTNLQKEIAELKKQLKI